jgi:acyl-CoA synthetase (AMP-forming)/AMP-acid ligase II
MYAPPTLIYGMLGDATASGRNYTSLRHVIYSAAPMRPDQIRAAQRMFGPVIETAYGQVEAPQIITAMRAADSSVTRTASIGRPSPGG